MKFYAGVLHGDRQHDTLPDVDLHSKAQATVGQEDKADR